MHLVDLEELEKANCGRCKEAKDGKWSIACLFTSCNWAEIMPILWKLPEIKAKPVRHRHWIRTGKEDACGGGEVKCSECGNLLTLPYERIENLAKYEAFCSMCGARMDAQEGGGNG